MLLEELEPFRTARREHGDRPSLQPELPLPPALPPMFQGTLTEDHWQGISADIQNFLGLPLGTSAVQDWVLSNVARKVSLAQEEKARAHTEALVTTEVAQAKPATSPAAAKRWTRAAAEERSHVMREWEEGDCARAAEVAAAARTSQEADAAVL